MSAADSTALSEALLGFKAHLRVRVVPGEAAYLVSPRSVTALRGRPAELLAPLLDGTRTATEVVTAVSGELTPEQAITGLRELVDAGLVRTRTVTPDPAAEAYWDLAGLNGGQAAADLARDGVRVVALGGLDAAAVEQACRETGLKVVPGRSAALTLVLCTDYLDPALAEIDARQRLARRPWLLARPVGPDLWTGPVFRPGENACWHCLATRLRGHRRSETALQRAEARQPADRGTGLPEGRLPRPRGTHPVEAPPAQPLTTSVAGPFPPPSVRPLPRAEASLGAGRALGLQTAVLEAAKWLAGHRYEGQDAVHTLDTLTLQGGAHLVTRRPQCPECGDGALVARLVRRPVTPVSRPKAPGTAGGHRALPPERVLAAYGHLVDPVTGVVKELRREPRGLGFTHSYLSGHNLALAPGSLGGLRAGLRALSGGKGLTDVEARAGALCEAVERYSGSWQGDEPVVRASYRELGGSAVHPARIQLFDERQYRDRERWNAVHADSAAQQVPAPFDETRVIDWTPVWSLTARERRLLPSSMLYFSAAAQADGLPWADSNGTAAGSSVEDAILQGFLELVERDAVALWWYNRTRQPAVDLDAFAPTEPWLAALLAGYRSVDREVWVLDLTADLGIPVMAALSRRTDKPAEDVLFGFGAHLDPAVALRRALTELGQLLPAVVDATADGSGYLVEDRTARSWWREETVARQPYLWPDGTVPARGPGSWEYRPRTDLREDIEDIVALTRRHGLELLVLDQTRPDIGLPVVRVIVPGLRHFWARFAPGRLYDVPVALGRVKSATLFEELNPIPLFV
ncbi:TOMM precursor leader peptide-binding protein [Kitasatospora sp. NPDC002227]|uniref:TOMM precursor leader peptide-binding protein n=1 Tax=Kitasatospora sp. NPDC002227 TaxID=3154773 RepID=UPI003322C787